MRVWEMRVEDVLCVVFVLEADARRLDLEAGASEYWEVSVVPYRPEGRVI